MILNVYEGTVSFLVRVRFSFQRKTVVIVADAESNPYKYILDGSIAAGSRFEADDSLLECCGMHYMTVLIFVEYVFSECV